MDPLTHGLLGASLGQALAGPALGRRALGWGALVAMAPDVDVLARPLDPLAEWKWHRGPTHGLLFVLVAGGLAGLLLSRREPGSLRAWLTLALAALLSHPLLDLCTTYGTQLLAPFSTRRFALDWIAIVDPAYSLLLAAGLATGQRMGAGTRTARRAGATVLALSSLYLALGGFVNARVERLARADLQARGPLVDAALATAEGRVFEWFAMGEATPRVEARGDVELVELDDLRYGFPGTPRDGFWGVRIRLAADGRPLGRGERFERPLPAPVSRLLYAIWRETLGWS